MVLLNPWKKNRTTASLHSFQKKNVQAGGKEKRKRRRMKQRKRNNKKVHVELEGKYIIKIELSKQALEELKEILERMNEVS